MKRLICPECKSSKIEVYECFENNLVLTIDPPIYQTWYTCECDNKFQHKYSEHFDNGVYEKHNIIDYLDTDKMEHQHGKNILITEKINQIIEWINKGSDDKCV